MLPVSFFVASKLDGRERSCFLKSPGLVSMDLLAASVRMQYWNMMCEMGKQRGLGNQGKYAQDPSGKHHNTRLPCQGQHCKTVSSTRRFVCKTERDSAAEGVELREWKENKNDEEN
jgi:hypothetical protein